MSLTTLTFTPQAGFTFDGFSTRAELEYTIQSIARQGLRSFCRAACDHGRVPQVNGGPI